MNSLTVFAPAKINLFLAITGKRSDGFHDLVSVVAPLNWGDQLVIHLRQGSGFELHCDAPGVPTDESNLVIKAAKLFAHATGWKEGAAFHLDKQTPAGAGLGGGSSDGTATLTALNQLLGAPLRSAELRKLAAQLGSDCVLFLNEAPCTMRGRGEQLEALETKAVRRISDRRIVVFKPSFGINTAWAYREMASEAPRHYIPAAEAEQRLSKWMLEPAQPLEALLFNNMESVAFRKYVALPALLQQLSERFGVAVRMSGSGSACYALLQPDSEAAAIERCIREAWGPDAFVIETTIR